MRISDWSSDVCSSDLIDLRTPRRWYNMLRIFRPTSPMSFGSYILTAFGGFSALTLLGEFVEGRGRLGRAAEQAAEQAQGGGTVEGEIGRGARPVRVCKAV